MLRNRSELENGGIAQLGEHLPYKQRVTGSIPVVPTIMRNAEVIDLRWLSQDSLYIALQMSALGTAG